MFTICELVWRKGKMTELTKAQSRVLRLIFEHRKTEEEALDEAKIARRIYDGWFRQASWLSEYSLRMRACQRTSDLIISTFKELAAAKLVQLTDCDKEAVARQSCLDILEMDIELKEQPEIAKKMSIRDETQAAIMQLIAKEKKQIEASSRDG